MPDAGAEIGAEAVPDLSRLIAPRSIAFIGGRDAAEAVRICCRFGYDGEIWPVSPTRAEMDGIPCVPDLDALPAAPDAAFIGVNRAASIGVAARLAAMGAGGAVAYASGYAETDDGAAAGSALQADLVAAAGAMPLLGPNCYGLLNAATGAAIWPSEHGLARAETGIALISQSTNITLSMTMQRRGLPIGFVGTVGNQAGIGLSTLARAALALPHVTALGLYVEAIDSAPGFEALAAEARAAGKPVVVLRAGRTAPAQAATLSHTASLAGSDVAAEAFFDRLGMARVASITALIETLKLLHVHGPLPDARLGALAASGGEVALIADAAAGRGVRFPALAAPHAAAVGATLNDIVRVANPIDYHTFIWADRARMTETFAAMLGGTGATPPFDLGLLVLDWVREDRCATGDWSPAIDAIEDAANRTGCRVGVVATLPENMPEALAERLIDGGLVPFCGIEDMIAAVEAATAIGAAWQGTAQTPLTAVSPPRGHSTLMDEAEAKAALAAHGVPVPKGQTTTPEGAEAVAARLAADGARVAVKALGLAHKTEMAAVALNLDPAAAGAAAQEMAGRLAIGRVLVEAMAPPPIAELIVGVTRAAPYGLTLTLGAGGVMAEMLDDTATLLLPASEAEIATALGRLRLAPVLAGHRGRPGVDMGATLAAIDAVQRYALAHADRLLELDVNPLMLGQDWALAADALIRLEDADHGTTPTEEPADDR
ncbi:MAG: acetate--CoA ligase family protein [Pseudomonadota bacterium]